MISVKSDLCTAFLEEATPSQYIQGTVVKLLHDFSEHSLWSTIKILKGLLQDC